MKSFVAIDFETANQHRSSVCSVGIVIVRNDKIVDSFYSPIHPTPNFYTQQTIAVHGMTNKDTDDAPIFPEVWEQIEDRVAGLPFVAHNKAFDEACLKEVFRVYQMDYPNYKFYCTCQTSRKKLPHLHNHKLDTVSAVCGYDLTNHHHAMADAEACAAIALKIVDFD